MIPQVTWLSRKPFPGYFSMEQVFQTLEPEISAAFEVKRWVCPQLSRGIRARIQNVRAASKTKGDLLHITGDVNYLALGLKGKKTVLTIHDSGYLDQASPWSRPFLKWFWVVLPVNKAARVTVISEESRQVILNESGCDPAKVVVIPNPVDPAFTFLYKKNLQEVPVVLQVGVKSNKNLERVVEALRELPVKLEILGAPSEAQQALMRQYGIDFHAQTNLRTDEVAALYQRSDLVLFASTFEGFGMPIIEAQASGTPVIVSQLAPMNTIAGEGALFVDPYSVADMRKAVEALLGNENLREKLAEAGRKNAEQYAAKTIAARYLNLYRQVLADSKN